MVLKSHLEKWKSKNGLTCGDVTSEWSRQTFHIERLHRHQILGQRGEVLQ